MSRNVPLFQNKFSRAIEKTRLGRELSGGDGWKVGGFETNSLTAKARRREEEHEVFILCDCFAPSRHRGSHFIDEDHP